MKLAFSIALVLPCILVGNPAIADVSTNIVFADNAVREGSRIYPGKINDTFQCGDPIYAIVAIEGLSAGAHSMNTVWLTPGGDVKKSDRAQVKATDQIETTYLSSFLVIQQNYPTNTDERSPFTGTWTVEVQGDGEIVGRQTLDVRC